MEGSSDMETRQKTTRDRLNAIAEFVLTIPPELFTMGHWWCAGGMAFDDDANKMYKVADGDCGCAIGHCINKGMVALTIDDLTKIPGDLGIRTETGVRKYAFGKIGEALGITTIEAEFIFDQYAYSHFFRSTITREQVADRLRFVAAAQL